MKLLNHVLIGASALLALAAAGCGGGGGGSESGSGTLSVRLADAPDPTISSIEVTIDRVEAHVGNEWVPITTVPQTFDLFDLQDDDTLLGSATLPAGHYTQIRLFPSSATVTDADGTHDVVIPSGVQTGVKLNVNYDIDPNTVTTILLDFNVDKSLHKTGAGQYMLQPVIPAVVKVLSGTITGAVTDGANSVQGATVKAIYTAGDKYPLDTEVNTSVTQEDGTFKIWALLPGTYRVDVSYEPTEGTTQTGTVADVTVVANQNTDAGTITISAP